MRTYSTDRLIVRGLAALAAWALASSALAASYYVATTGSDSAGDGTLDKPFRTIGVGLNRMASGDTLIVKPGTYNDLENFINGRTYRIPSGTASRYTTIAAEVPFSVRIRNTKQMNYWDSALRLNVDYVRVDGFIFEINQSQDPEYIADIDGRFNKVTRSIFKRTGATNQYGGWVQITGSDNLLEDCAGVGSARYGFAIGGPNSTAQRNILRRCVGRVDYSVSNQPKATFNVYGNNSGNNVRDTLLQNCIAIDGRKGPNSSESTYGGFYFPKNATRTTIQGSIVLNVEAEHAGYFVKELGAQDLKMVNSIAWGGYGTNYIAGIRANSSGQGTYFELDHVTVGGYVNGYYNQDSAPSRILRNSLFLNNGARTSSSDYGWTASHNGFFPASQAVGSNGVAVSAGALKYLVRVEPGTAAAAKGSDGLDIGANVTKRYGRSGTLWGEPGYDQITSDSLWPWSFEDHIKRVFAEPHSPPAGAVPSTNDTTRGFAAATDPFGKPMTLTRYIWQYLGSEIPAEIYGSGPLAPERLQGLKATILP